MVRKIFISSLVLLSYSFISLNGQAYRFRNYGSENSLPSQVIYTLNQDRNGYLWTGTANGLYRFDGFDFFNVQFPDSSDARYPTASLSDSNGRLWFGCNDGTLYYTDDRTLNRVNLEGSSGTGFCSIIEGADGYIYAVGQRKPVFRIKRDKPEEVQSLFFDSDPNLLAACFSVSGELLLGTQENLLIFRITGDSLSIRETVEGFDYYSIRSIIPLGREGSFLIGTDGNGFFRLVTSGGSPVLSRLTDDPDLQYVSVVSMQRDSTGKIWAAAPGTGVIKIEFSGSIDSVAEIQVLDQASGMAGINTTVVFQDNESNIWIGFNGDGLSMLGTDPFEFYSPGKGKNPDNVIFTGSLRDNFVLGTPSGFYLFDVSTGNTDRFIRFPGIQGRNEISSYCIDDDENIWVGTRGTGLFLAAENGTFREFYRSGDTGADYINDIKTEGDRIWLATLNGVIIVSKSTRQILGSYNMHNGLPHNSINQILLKDDGSGYIATESDRLYRVDIDSGIMVSEGIMYGNLLNKIQGLSADRKNRIWVTTLGNGTFGFTSDSVSMIGTGDGLLSNYTYSILADNENKIWIGHERGISVYNPETGITRVYETGFAAGGSCNLNALYQSPGGKIFVGTTKGVIIYDATRERKSQKPPRNNVNAVIINNIEYPYQKTYTLPYRKRYTVTVRYAGINFSEPGKVYYSTFLENYDDDWSEESASREVTYSLNDGKYWFNLVSVNEEGISQESMELFSINIKHPFWRAWWFILSMTAVASAIVVLIIREREKAQKKIQAYLEKELEARTRVVMKQKAEIEMQNMEITDSINYAKRIQTSILPDINRLKEHFGDAFVMLYPRDIVSGDFYWFEKLDNDRVVLACADSTGHGVPGAFMSMIGSTLLQDIVSRQRISKPSEILTMLDKQIFSILNQNLEVGVSNDGMDIVVCEFTMKNRHVRFASAMRPVILVMGGETFYIKGNRSSVGGQTVLEKYFDDQEYYLNEGDAIYMFSDGLPDQFGGPEGKKMKVARLKTMISDLHSFPISRQEEEFTKFFREWKGNYEQVDDILFMGVKI